MLHGGYDARRLRAIMAHSPLGLQKNRFIAMSFSPANLLRAALVAALVASPLALTGCIYRMQVQQGNFLEDKELNQVQLGMTRAQVRYLLGTPMVADPFENSRWDYVYTLKQGVISKARRRHFVVHFTDDKVVKMERPSDSAS
jgi:outer membrane protein assembly factor BamE